jgi:uncharacterized protein
MTVRERFERLAMLAARRPALTLAIVVVAALGGGVLALQLKPSTGTDTFVSRSSASYRATAQDDHNFGSDPIVIMIREPLTDLVQTTDLDRVSFLEACLAGQYVADNKQLAAFTPIAHAPYGGWASPCGKLMRAKPVQAVYGPGTFLNRAVAAVNTEVGALEAGVRQQVVSAQQSAYQLAIARGLSTAKAKQAASTAGLLELRGEYQQLTQIYGDSGITGTPSISDPQFIPEIVFDPSRGAGQPKARFAYLFPTADSALIQVRLKASLSDAQQAAAISWIRQAVNMPQFRSRYGGTYTVTGAPVVLNDLSSELTGSIVLLLIGAVLVMAVTLLIVFRTRPRLLPLALALGAVGITFGVVSVAGATLTMASVAVLPILIGLAVDYGIQFQARTAEVRAALGDGPATAPEAVARAAGAAAPTIATAAVATATGFLVLLLSPVPMVRGFGVVLVVGIAVALACALTAGPAAIVLAERTRRPPHRAVERSAPNAARARRARETFLASARGAADILRDGARPLSRIKLPRRPAPDRQAPGRLLSAVMRRPGRVLAIAVALAAIGWVADTQTAVQSDVTKLVPSSMPALHDLNSLERTTGVSGEIDVTVRSSDVSKLATVRWMISYERALLAHYGYRESQGCAHATLCPALSLPDLFPAGTETGTGSGPSLTQSSINSLLGAVPQYFRQAVITSGNREAVLAFGIRLMPLARQQRVIAYMRSQLHPPAGVTVALAGLPVLAAQANAALSSSGRRLLTLVVGLLAVGLVLLVIFRRVRRAVVPLVPIALATGWSSLILFATRIPLNPMSATLGALVIAISTEFSVLLAERFAQERAGGRDVEDALRHTYRSTGAAVRASGITAIAGFAVLVLSDITMLREFGFVTVIDLAASLFGVQLVLPAVLVLSERGGARERVRSSVARAGAGLPRVRRGARVA